jgi:hypothetical protein
MMNQNDLVIIEPIIEQIVQKIADENKISPMEAVDLFSCIIRSGLKTLLMILTANY